MVEALAKELFLRKDYLREAVSTIYYGGGTPSLLSLDELQLLQDTVAHHYQIVDTIECTLEANPDDISMQKLMQWKQAGVNRLSIGLQSFSDKELKWMNRAHSAQQAEECVRMTHEAGFSNFSIDLIYGSPLLTDDEWMNNISRVLTLAPPHISCYALTVEENTVLHHKILKHIQVPPDSEKQSRQYYQMIAQLTDAGYEQYEISNFSLKGFKSRHNSSYWQGTHYLGIGPSAHSYNGKSRQWNLCNNALYLKSVSDGIVPFEIEILTRQQQMNESIMIQLRTNNGLNLSDFQKQFGENYRKKLQQAAQKHIVQKTMKLVNDRLVLSLEGQFFADGISSDLFFHSVE
jgi:oxygen-independent coproporphyrinogen-3 oxidase